MMHGTMSLKSHRNCQDPFRPFKDSVSSSIMLLHLSLDHFTQVISFHQFLRLKFIEVVYLSCACCMLCTICTNYMAKCTKVMVLGFHISSLFVLSLPLRLVIDTSPSCFCSDTLNQPSDFFP